MDVSTSSIGNSWVDLPPEKNGHPSSIIAKSEEFPTPAEAIERGLNPTLKVSEMGESETGIPSVADMLEKGAATKSHVPSIDKGDNLSFAEVAATEPPPAPPSYSKRDGNNERRDGAAPPKREVRQEAPPPLESHTAYPSLTEANPVGPVEGEDDLSEMPSVKEMLDVPSEGAIDHTHTKSYVSATTTDLNKAPPSAQAKPVDKVPVYDETQYLHEEKLRFQNKVIQNEDQLEDPQAVDVPEVREVIEEVQVTEEEEVQTVIKKKNLREKEEVKEAVENEGIKNAIEKEGVKKVIEKEGVKKVIEKEGLKKVIEEGIKVIEEGVKVDNVVEEEHDIDRRTTMTDLQRHASFFDRNQDGKVTMDETYISLRALGYSVFLSIPATLILHLRFSPPTSPHPPPFRYRTLVDFFTLPIHISRIHKTLSYTPLLSRTRAPRAQNFRSGAYDLLTGEFREDRFDTALRMFSTTAKIARVGVRVMEDGKYVTRVSKSVDELKKGEHVDSVERSMVEGVGFWRGLRMVGGIGREDRGRWWDASGWLVNKFQWYLTYTLLRDRRTGLVTRESLRGAYDGSAFYQIEEGRYAARQHANKEKKEKKEKA